MPIWQRGRSTRALAAAAFLIGVLLSHSVGELQGETPPLIPLGGQFELASEGPGYVSGGSPAARDNGRFIVAWNYTNDDPLYSTEWNRFRLFEADGKPEGDPVDLDVAGDDWDGGSWLGDPEAAPGANSGFVTAWDYSYSWAYHYYYYDDDFIRGRVLDADGSQIGSFGANHPTDFVGRTSISTDSTGRIVMGFERGGGADARLFTADGTPEGDPFTVADDDASSVSTARAPDGRFVVVWLDHWIDHVFGRLFDSVGNPLGGEFQISDAAITGSSYRSTAVSMHSGGDFVVVWRNDVGEEDDVFSRRFEADGTPAGDEFRVNTITAGDQERPKVVHDQSGGFVVTWIGPVDDTTGVFMRQFDANGAPVAPESLVSDPSLGWAGAGGVAATDDGGLIAVWPGELPPTSGRRIWGRLFGRPYSGGLVSYWDFEDGAGSSIVRDRHSENDGSLTNMDPATAWVAGKFRAGLHFSGDPEYVNFSNDTSLDVWRGMSLSVWVRPDDIDGIQTVFAKDVASGSNSFMLFSACDWNHNHTDAPRGLLAVGDGGPGSVLRSDAATPLNPGQWHHLVMTYDVADGVLRLYIDGALAATRSDPDKRSIHVTDVELVAGAKSSLENFFRGTIDDAALWNRPLLPEEIAGIWNDGAGTPLFRLLFPDVFADGFESGDTSGWSATVP